MNAGLSFVDARIATSRSKGLANASIIIRSGQGATTSLRQSLGSPSPFGKMFKPGFKPSGGARFGSCQRGMTIAAGSIPWIDSSSTLGGAALAIDWLRRSIIRADPIRPYNHNCFHVVYRHQGADKSLHPAARPRFETRNLSSVSHLIHESRLEPQ